MEGKAFLKQVQNQFIADLLIDELAAAGFEAYASQGSYPYPHPAGPVEIWLKDSAILEQPGAWEAIDAILNPPILELAPEDEIPLSLKSRLRWWHFTVASLILFAAWIGYFGQDPKPYQFMKGAYPMKLTREEVAYFERYATNGYILLFEEPSASVAKKARAELLKVGFIENSSLGYPVFDKLMKDDHYKRLYEFISVSPAESVDRNTKAVSDDPKRTIVWWGYRPSLPQALRRLMGF